MSNSVKISLFHIYKTICSPPVIVYVAKGLSRVAGKTETLPKAITEMNCKMPLHSIVPCVFDVFLYMSCTYDLGEKRFVF